MLTPRVSKAPFNTHSLLAALCTPSTHHHVTSQLTPAYAHARTPTTLQEADSLAYDLLASAEDLFSSPGSDADLAMVAHLAGGASANDATPPVRSVDLDCLDFAAAMAFEPHHQHPHHGMGSVGSDRHPHPLSVFAELGLIPHHSQAHPITGQQQQHQHNNSGHHTLVRGSSIASTLSSPHSSSAAEAVCGAVSVPSPLMLAGASSPLMFAAVVGGGNNTQHHQQHHHPGSSSGVYRHAAQQTILPQPQLSHQHQLELANMNMAFHVPNKFPSFASQQHPYGAPAAAGMYSSAPAPATMVGSFFPGAGSSGPNRGSNNPRCGMHPTTTMQQAQAGDNRQVTMHHRPNNNNNNSVQFPPSSGTGGVGGAGLGLVRAFSHNAAAAAAAAGGAGGSSYTMDSPPPNAAEMICSPTATPVMGAPTSTPSSFATTTTMAGGQAASAAPIDNLFNYLSGSGFPAADMFPLITQRDSIDVQHVLSVLM